MREIVPSHHCVVRFRQRRPVRERGSEAVADALIRALEDSDVSRWPPAWAIGDRRTEMWAVNGRLAFPLERSAGTALRGHHLPDGRPTNKYNRATAAAAGIVLAGGRSTRMGRSKAGSNGTARRSWGGRGGGNRGRGSGVGGGGV